MCLFTNVKGDGYNDDENVDDYGTDDSTSGKRLVGGVCWLLHVHVFLFWILV